MVPNTSDDLPDPETPVNTVSRRLGMSTLTSFRLFSRAPRTRMRSWLSAECGREEAMLARSCHRRRRVVKDPGGLQGVFFLESLRTRGQNGRRTGLRGQRRNAASPPYLYSPLLLVLDSLGFTTSRGSGA